MSFDRDYFRSGTYENISFARFSQYWWSNRFYAMLARRYAPRGARLLEIGSGLGHLVGQLEGHFRTCAIDVNFWALSQSIANASFTPLQVAAAEALPFASASFDLIIIKHVIEHLQHPERAIAELARVCAPGAALILSTPNMDSLLKSRKGSRWIGYRDKTHISLKPPQEWLDLIQTAGFRLLRVFADGFWDVPYIQHVPAFIQKLIFGLPGGFQAVTGWVVLPLHWGESMMVVARRYGAP